MSSYGGSDSPTLPVGSRGRSGTGSSHQLHPRGAHGGPSRGSTADAGTPATATGPAEAPDPHRGDRPAPRAEQAAPRLRPLTARDRALIEEFVRDDPAYTRISFDELPSARDVEAILDGAPGNAGPGAHQVLGAFSADGALLGVAQAVHRWPGLASCYLGLLQVHPAHRAQGIGATLLAAVENSARSRGCRQVLLSVIARNRPGRSFWHHHGFQELHPRQARAAGPLAPVLMHKPL